METLKIVVVVGILAAAVAVGLAYAWGAISGSAVGGDEILRHAILSFLIAACVIRMLRRRPTPPG